MLIHVLSVLPDGSVHGTGTPLPAKLDVRTSLDSEQRRASHQEFQIQSPYLNASAAIASGFLLVCSSKMPPVKQRQALSETRLRAEALLFEGESLFSTWLTRMSINEALMLLRRKRRSREVPISESGTEDEIALPLDIP